MPDEPTDLARAVGERLRRIRMAHGHTQMEWGRINGFTNTAISNWESGIRLIPVDSAEVLCRRYGLTLDYIYRGIRSGLSKNALNVL